VGYLDFASELDGFGRGLDEVAELCGTDVVDGELHAGEPLVARGDVAADARGDLRHERRHAAIESVEGLFNSRAAPHQQSRSGEGEKI
jgi:hypothetical protein